MMIRICLSTVFFSFIAIQAKSNQRTPNIKWALEISSISQKFMKEDLPVAKVDTWWANPKYNQNSGLMMRGSIKQYRHMHAMVIAAFFAKRKDHQKLAKEWLGSYQCENIIACEDLIEFYERALEATVSDQKRKSEIKEKDQILTKAKLRLQDVKKNTPKPQGLCQKDSMQGAWLEIGYELYCWNVSLPPEQGLCPDCQSTKDMAFRLGRATHQSVMSSSYLEGIEHIGAADCMKPWETVIKCGGHKASTFKFLCQQTTSEYPLKIQCTPKI